MFDITRVGAAGIYSNLTPYREKVIHGETGYLCPNETDKWVAAITQLLSDGELRTSIYLKARDWCAETCSSQTV
jgi:glycosyltransferase involved in cell wall biosynthesis